MSTAPPPGPATRPGRLLLAANRRRITEWVLVATAGAVLVVAVATGNRFLADRLGAYFLYAVFALSVDLVWGYGGMFTFGHAAFFGWAGYVVAILTTREYGPLPLPFLVALPAGVAFSALLAWGLGAFVFSGRLALRGVEFAVVTLAIAYLSERAANVGGTVTGERNGIITQTRLGLFLDFHKGYGFYLFAALLLVGSYLGLRRFVASETGLVLRGIRENEDRVALLGYDVAAAKRRAFALSGALAGLAGALFFTHEGIIAPPAVGIQLSTLVLLWVVLGGRGTLLGPIVGAVALPYLTARLSSGALIDVWLLIVGGLLVGVIMLFPAGVFGFLNREEEA